MKLPPHMRALTRTTYGGPEVLRVQEIPIPKPKAGEILIKVHATTINRTDCAILRGNPFALRFFTGLTKPKQLVPGTDFAGEVVALGTGAKRFAIGDRLWGFNDQGLASQAEYLCISEKAAIEKIPPNTSYPEAAASAEGAHYALNFLNKVALKEGDHVLVNGATGAIGSAMVQLLHHKNIRVTATGVSQQLTLLGKLGADEVIDCIQEDFTQGTQRYDFVFDAVGKSNFTKCKPILTSKGIYISSELGPNAQNLYLPLLRFLGKKKHVRFPFPSNIKGSLSYMNALLEENAFNAVLDRYYGLEQAQEAYTYVESGQKIGNVILQLAPQE